MGTATIGTSAFSGLVESFELTSQYGLFDEAQERDWRALHDHADARAALASAHLRKIHDPHGTPDVSRHAAVRLSSDGSRDAGPQKKAPTLKLAGPDDSAGGKGRPNFSGTPLVVAGMHLIVVAPGRAGENLLASTLKADGATILGVARFLQSEAVDTQTLIQELPAGDWKTAAQKIYEEASTQGKNLGAFCKRDNLNIEGSLRAAMTLISRMQVLAETLPETDMDATYDRFAVTLESLSGDIFIVVQHALDHASTYDFRDDSAYVKNPATLDRALAQLTQVLHALFDAGTSGAAERFEDELMVTVSEIAFQARLSPALRKDYAAFKESLEFLAAVKTANEADLVAIFMRVTDLVEIYNRLWADVQGSENTKEVLVEFWPTVQDHLRSLAGKLREVVGFYQSRQISKGAMLAIYDQVIRMVNILMDGLSYQDVLFSTQEETDLLNTWYGYPPQLAKITGQSIFKRQMMIMGGALWQRFQAVKFW